MRTYSYCAMSAPGITMSTACLISPEATSSYQMTPGNSGVPAAVVLPQPSGSCSFLVRFHVTMPLHPLVALEGFHEYCSGPLIVRRASPGSVPTASTRTVGFCLNGCGDASIVIPGVVACSKIVNPLPPGTIIKLPSGGKCTLVNPLPAGTIITLPPDDPPPPSPDGLTAAPPCCLFSCSDVGAASGPETCAPDLIGD